MVYPVSLPLMRTPRLPVVDRTDAATDLNGLVRLAERRNLVSARLPSHFNWPVPSSLHIMCRKQRSFQKASNLFLNLKVFGIYVF